MSPTVAPRSLGPISGRGGASTLWVPWASRSATLRAGRRVGDQRSIVRVHLQKSCSLAEEAKIFMFSLLARAQIIGFKLLAGNVALIRKFEKTVLPLGLLSLTRAGWGSFIFSLTRSPPIYKYWRRDFYFYFYLSLPLLPCLLAFPLAKVHLRRFFLSSFSSKCSGAELQGWRPQNILHLRRWLRSGINQKGRRQLCSACRR